MDLVKSIGKFKLHESHLTFGLGYDSKNTEYYLFFGQKYSEITD